MKNKNINQAIITSIATGAIVSTTAYMLSNNKNKTVDKTKKHAGKALKTVGSVIENATHMMK